MTFAGTSKGTRPILPPQRFLMAANAMRSNPISKTVSFTGAGGCSSCGSVRLRIPSLNTAAARRGWCIAGRHGKRHSGELGMHIQRR